MIKRILSMILVLIMAAQVLCITASADANALTQDLDAITWNSLVKVSLGTNDYLIDTLRLPTQGANGSTISWSCEPFGVISTDSATMGAITRPDEDTDVTLTATGTNEDATDTRTYTFKVPGKDTRAYDMPLPTNNVFFEDNFDDGVIDEAYIVPSPGNGTVTEEGGALKLVKSSGTTGVTFYTNADQTTGATGQVVTEFVIKRQSAYINSLSTQYYGSNGKPVSVITLWTGQITLSYAATKGGAEQTAYLNRDDFGAFSTVKITQLFDTETQRLVYWINNKFAASGYALGANDVHKIFSYNGSSSLNDTIDDFRCYKGDFQLSDAMSVEADHAGLSQASLYKIPLVGTYLMESLNLPTVGGNGSTISWHSTHPDVISTTGWLTRPAADTEVTLTATVSKGEAQDLTKAFTFSVPGRSTEVGDLPLVGEVKAYDDFDDGTAGSLVTLDPGQGTAVEQNGRIELEKTGAAGMTQAHIYLKEDKSAVHGQFAVEFTLTRKNNATPASTSIGVYGDNVGVGTQAAQLVWWHTAWNLVALEYAQTRNGDEYSDTSALLTNYGAANTLKVTLYFDTNSQRVFFWLNNKFVAKGYTTGADGVSCIHVYNGTVAFDTTIDDFRYYTASLPGSAAQNVADDLAMLTETSLLKVAMSNGKIADSLNLPTLGENGSDISWHSSNPKVIAEDGTVYRQLTDTTVTLTATANYLDEAEDDKTFTYTVAGLDARIGGMPKLTSLAYMENFNDGIVDEDHFILTDGNGSVTESGGTLNIIKPTASGTSSAEFYAKADRGEYTGKILVEFLMSRKSEYVMSAQMSGLDGLFGIVDWWPRYNGVNIQHADVKNGERLNHFALQNDNSVKDKIKVSVLFSPDDDQLSVWLNETLYAEGGWSCGGKGFSKILFYNGSSTCNASIDDIRIYYVQEEDEKAVALDMATLESFFTPGELTPGLLYESVYPLPIVGNHGSTITWSSDNTGLVDNEGNVTRPNSSEDEEVNITATVTCGGASDSKVLTYKVLRAGSGDQVVAEMDASLLELSDFLETVEPISGYISQNLNLPIVGQYGSSIEWESSHPTIINNDGVIVNVPATAADSPEITMTATVIYGDGEATQEIRFRVSPEEIGSLRQELPPFNEMIYEEDFSDDEKSASHWELRPYGDGVAQINGGKMQLTRRVEDSMGLNTHAMIFAHESRVAQQGLVAFDFFWEKVDADQEGYIEIEGTENRLLSTLTWQADGTIAATFSNKKGGGATREIFGPYDVSDGAVRVTGLLNSDSDTWTLWLNEEIVLKDKYPATSTEAGILGIEMQLAGRNFTTMYVDNLRFYKAKPYVYELASMDAVKLTDNDIVTGGFAMDRTIDSDVTLPTTGFYGSEIVWTSSDPSIIDPLTGEVHRPENAAENPQVTLTATLHSGDYVAIKEFTYYVLTGFSTDSQYVAADLERLTFENYGIYSFDDNSLDCIRYSLNLPSELAYSSKIMWSTSDATAITSSGRVIRPTWNQPAKTVTLTATLTYGSCTETKDFTLVVQPDEELKDPNYQPDDEFFGTWNGTTWTKEPAFNYAANPEMSAVEAAAKAGDYEAAKVALLAYMQSRPASPINNSSAARNTDYVDQMFLTGVWHYQSDRYYMGHGTIRSHEYEKVRIPIRLDLLAEGLNSFNIAAKYHESSSVSIISKDHPDSSMHPKLEVTIDGATYNYPIVADATIRGGQYDYTNFGFEDTLHVKMFGEHQGEEYESAVLKFDTTGLPGGTRNSIYVVVYAKIDQDYVDAKELLVHEEPNISWPEDKVSYGSLPKYYYNMNGIPGEMNWLRAYPKYTDSEFHQTHRFQNISQALAEYEYTNDEKYAYKMIYTMMDYIIDSQYEMSLNEWRAAQGGYKWSDYEELDKLNNNGTTPGYMRVTCGMPQMLSTSFRLTAWVPIYERLMHSEYMTPDVCTAIMKNFWGVTDWGDYYLTNYSLQMPKTPHNQWVHEAMCLSQVALSFPEFADSEAWLDTMMRVLYHVKEGGYADDGAYGETANGYSAGVLNQFIAYVLMMKKAEHELPAGFEEFLYNAVIYNEIIARDPGGIAMSWGDSGWANVKHRQLPNYEQLSKDPTYLFLDTRGAEGAKPDWTSIHFPSLRVTGMRSDWSEDALHVFIDNNGVGGHGHRDDNAMRVAAYGEYLLTDPGMFSYEDNLYRRFGLSTRSHNTVEIDDQSQNYANESLFDMSQADTLLWGTVQEWSTNKQFDVLSQTSTSYQKTAVSSDDFPEVDHRRTITFLKSGFWIVSDLMLPQDGKAHDYKQLWHMIPDANQVLDIPNGQIKSNKIGANLILSSPDGQLTPSPVHDPDNPKSIDGWFTRRWGMYEYTPYAYYALDDVSGNQGIDTLIFPYRTQGQGSASTEDIDLGVAVDVATAMKMTTTMDGETSETHYMLQYAPTQGSVRTFGEYEGDGMVNVVRTDENGNIRELILNQGSILRRVSDGKVLLEVDGAVGNVGLEMRGETVAITTCQSTGNQTTINPDQIFFYADGNVKNVIIDGTYYVFDKDSDGNVSLEDEETDEFQSNDASNDKGGLIGNEGGNQGGNAGNEGGNQGGIIGGEDNEGNEGDNQGGIITPPADDKLFHDIDGHWAEDSINAMAEKGVVQGDNGSFRPDASISRAELVTMVVRALQLPVSDTDTGFSDVAENGWYASYVKAALKAGIISADTVFRPNDQVTREEMAKILSVANSLYKQQTLDLSGMDSLSYADASSVSDWAKAYIGYASKHGLMNGMENNQFVPKASATRAQVVTVLDRIFKG